MRKGQTRKDLRLDLVGVKVGKLIIIKFYGLNKNHHTLWKAKCDCGRFKIVLGKDFKRGKGGTKCDQCHLEEKRNRAIQHGDCNTIFYKSWIHMKRRCDQEKDFVKYLSYKGRGIKYDNKWFYYEEFKKDMYFKYIWASKYYGIKNLTLERIDNNKGYNFENCKFIPMKYQGNNKSNVKKFKAISPDGKVYITKNMSAFGRKFNLNPSHIGEVLRKESKHHKKWKFEYLI